MLAECVNRRFRDLESGAVREIGDRFECTPARLAEINSAGYGQLAMEVGGARELSEMTRSELLAIVAEKGLKAPSKATKAQLAAIIGGE